MKQILPSYKPGVHKLQ